MFKLVDKYFAISPKGEPNYLIDRYKYLYDIRVDKEYYSSLDDAKENFLQITGVPYTGPDNPSQYCIVEVVRTTEVNLII